MSRPLVPFTEAQNPAPSPVTGQAYQANKQALVNLLMQSFRSVLPSNYVSQVNGPWYTLQFQAMLEQLVDAQLTANEVLKDSSWDFTRPEFLWQALGTLVFPGGGVPRIDGDVRYREFLRGMVRLLLQGATTQSMKEGVELLDPDLVVQVVENYLATPPRDPVGGKTLLDQFGVEVFVSTASGGFPADPFVTERNARMVLAALKPAHVLYTYSYLFTDAFEKVADDEGGLSLALDTYYYDDARKYCEGAKEITGTALVSASRLLLTDPSLSFYSVRPGAVLRVTSGVNAGVYTVTALVALLGGTDTTPRSYVTTPTGLTGTLTASGPDTLTDPLQNWGLAAENEQVTIAGGANAGTYRLDTVLGSAGGAVGSLGVSGTSVRVSPSTLKVNRRFVATGSTPYEVDVDRLGVRSPQFVAGEDASVQFYL
jgi:hypothetical protein